MTKEELIQLADDGDIAAAKELTSLYVHEKNIGQAIVYAEKVAKTGNVFYINTLIDLLSLYSGIMFDMLRFDGLEDAIKYSLEANRWAGILNDSGVPEAKRDTDNINGDLAWYSYLLQMQTKDDDYFYTVIRFYEQIENKPGHLRSRTAYTISLAKTGRVLEVVDSAFELISEMECSDDDMIKDFVPILANGILEAHIVGNGITMDVSKASKYIGILKRYFPDDPNIDIIEEYYGIKEKPNKVEKKKKGFFGFGKR